MKVPADLSAHSAAQGVCRGGEGLLGGALGATTSSRASAHHHVVAWAHRPEVAAIVAGEEGGRALNR